MVQAPPVVMRVFHLPLGWRIGALTLGEPSERTSSSKQQDMQRQPSMSGIRMYSLALAGRL